jgi:predicted lipoprotein with Yx(FWY)xxD motif
MIKQGRFLTLGAILLFSQVVQAEGVLFNLASNSTKRELTTITTNREGEPLLADAIGKTLYTFDLDKGTGTSVCSGDCAEVWPPLLVTAEETKFLQAPFGTVIRSNRKAQLTHEGQPVYSYAFDRVQGDEIGDGIGGVWHYIKVEKN